MIPTRLVGSYRYATCLRIHRISAATNIPLRTALIFRDGSVRDASVRRSFSAAPRSHPASKEQSIFIDKAIRNTRHCPELWNLVERYHVHFDHRNWASLLNQLKRYSLDLAQEHHHNPLYNMLQLLQEKLVTDLRAFDPLAISNILHALAKLNVRNTRILETIDAHAEWLVASCTNKDTQTLSILAWSFAKLKFRADRFFSCINDHAPTWMQQHPSPQSVANIAHAFAKLQFRADQFFDLLNAHAHSWTRNAGPQEISNALWACGTLGYPAPNLCALIDQNALYLLRHGTPQALANIAWSCATLGCPAPTLFQLLNEHVSQWTRMASVQNVSNVAWAFSTLEVEAPILFQWMERHAMELAQKGSPQAISNIAWAFATQNYQAPTFFRAMDENATRLVSSPHNTALAAWACSKIQYKALNLFQAMEENASFLTQEGDPQSVSLTTLACAKLQYDTPNLLNGVEARAESLVANGSPQTVSNLALAFSELGHASSSFFESVALHMDRILPIDSTKTQVLCNIMWSLVVLDLPGRDGARLLQKLWKLAIETDSGSFSAEGLQQLYQIERYASAHGVELDELPRELETAVVRSAMNQKPNHDTKQEDFCSAVLHQIGFSHETEVSPFHDSNGNSFLAIDFACREQRIAVELDGVYHFLTRLEKGSTPTIGRENGGTTSKRRVLQKLGWRVVNIPYMEFNQCEKKEDYLKRKLTEVGAILSPNSSY